MRNSKVTGSHKPLPKPPFSKPFKNPFSPAAPPAKASRREKAVRVRKDSVPSLKINMSRITEEPKFVRRAPSGNKSTNSVPKTVNISYLDLCNTIDSNPISTHVSKCMLGGASGLNKSFSGDTFISPKFSHLKRAQSISLIPNESLIPPQAKIEHVKKVANLEGKVKAVEKQNGKLLTQLQGEKGELKKLAEENLVLKQQLMGTNKKLEYLLKGIHEITQSIDLGPCPTERTLCKSSTKHTESQFDTTFGSIRSPLQQRADLSKKFGKLLGDHSKILGEDESSIDLKEALAVKEKLLAEMRENLRKVKNSLENLVQE